MASQKVKDTPRSRGHPRAVRNPDNVLEGEDELFMTLSPEEEKEWEAMMKSRQEKLAKNAEDYKRWVDAFTRRRMFAYSRIRKLDQARRERFRFVFKMAEVIRIANDKIYDLNSKIIPTEGGHNPTDGNEDTADDDRNGNDKADVKRDTLNEDENNNVDVNRTDSAEHRSGEDTR